MDFKDSDFEKAQEVNSNTQLYKSKLVILIVKRCSSCNIRANAMDGKERVYAEI